MQPPDLSSWSVADLKALIVEKGDAYKLSGALEKKDLREWQRKGKFNEVIVGGLWWERHLPHAIAAVVYTTTSYWQMVLGPGLGKPEESEKARRLHAGFVASYREELLRAGRTVPLVRFDGHTFEDVT